MEDGGAAARLHGAEVRDFWPRVLASPVLGAGVSTLSGLIDPARHSTAMLLASYGWFAVVAFVVWEGNRRLYFRLQRRDDWLLRPWRRLSLLLAVICVFTIPAAAAMLWAWRAATGDPGTRPYALTTALFGIVALVVAITHVYETVFLLRDWESDRLRSARMEGARLQVELESLGREVDPHFLFNSLTALAQLVDRRDEASSAFIGALGATYRYVLECRGRPLVTLGEELEALDRHRVMAEIRYGGGVRVDVDVPPDARTMLLPPVTLPELFQNVFKHNTVAPADPLAIRVWVEGAALLFGNELRSGRRPAGSTGIGLRNLQERFRIATGRPAEWGVRDGWFVVRLPLTRAGVAPA
jgi:hypothetical protein